MQADWIGKSYGAEVDFQVDGRDDKITVYTTRPDTLHGATFMVLAPEHALAKELATDETREAVEQYIYDASMKSNVDRMQDKEKTGVFTGSYAINPINGAKYRFGCLIMYWQIMVQEQLCVYLHMMTVTLHLQKIRDPDHSGHCKRRTGNRKYGRGIHRCCWNYDQFRRVERNGISRLKKEAPHIIEERGIGKATVNYKLRDWVFSRQRYWGEPIPIVHCPECGAVPVPEEELPLRLPDVDSYEPTGTGESPLAGIEEWVNCKCPVCGKDAKRETNTMPQWAGSSWYFLRYVDSHNDKELVSREKADEIAPVDM